MSGLVVAGGAAWGLTGCKGRPEGQAAQDDVLAGVTPSGDGDFPLHDLHIHATASLSYEEIVDKAKEAHFDYVGIMFNATRPTPATDETLQKFLDDTSSLDCFRGMQNMRLGWTKNLSSELYEQMDYIFMDPQVIPNGNKYGDTLEVWEHDCYVSDLDDFMDVNLKHYERVINNDEPLDVFGWPLYLPPCIGRFYDRLWTRDRLTYVVDLLAKRGLAVEINDFAHTPHEEFILMCKKAGLKFFFGSDSRDYRSFRLDYCKDMARKCGLVESDFYKPVSHRR